MKVLQHPKFNTDFPEEFNWGLLDSVKMTELALEVASHIKFDIEIAKERTLIPGMRRVLLIIAGNENLL